MCIRDSDIKIAKHPEYLDQLSNDDISQIFDEMVLFETFLVLERYRANDYLNLLIRLIEESKPSLIALKAAERYRNSLLAPSSGWHEIGTKKTTYSDCRKSLF